MCSAWGCVSALEPAAQRELYAPGAIALARSCWTFWRTAPHDAELALFSSHEAAPTRRTAPCAARSWEHRAARAPRRGLLMLDGGAATLGVVLGRSGHPGHGALGSHPMGAGDRVLDEDMLRAFARRDWNRVHGAKEAAWSELRESHGAVGLLVLASAATEHVGACTELRSDEARREDLAAHVTLKRRIDGANAKLSRTCSD